MSMNYEQPQSGMIGGNHGETADRVPGFGPRLEGAREDVSALCARLANLADRLVGAPTSTQAGAVNPNKLAAVSNGVFASIEDAANHISDRARWANEQISRIEQALP